ncbi:C39 family peptidase [Simiduia sp. 21SJ11W-1]|uniref:C39 family peptidase n=1 Tax=Simiduia sp. 21SJ11W-1 TaxID=2909669 RepID=UPI0020A20452|nr:C39 family peptidase [Simiduia sp. 21SJ11W-1]UTA48373.1 C39 family peptidase [Simiduia sp. 21SJ11W-1]
MNIFHRTLGACTLALAGLVGFSGQAQAACPDGASFDNNLSFCVSDTYAFGPFTNAMVNKCVQFGGGSACTTKRSYLVNGQHTINVLRWTRSFAQNIRGTGSCPIGSVRSATYGNHCFESVPGGTNNVYGNFTADEVAKCEYLNGGNACYTNRWSANFYQTVQNTTLPPAGGAAVNKFGAWLWYIDELGKTHTQLADELAAMGVKRIFIKIADDTANCTLFTDACSTTTTQIYKDRGIEPWAWSYNYPGDENAQADALYLAAQYGYLGFVLDVEVEFNNTTTALHSLFQAFQQARNDARNDGHISGEFPMGATTWGNPLDQGMRVDIIDQYVDFHMPQTYLEVWGASYMADPKYWIEYGNCEYRDMGANKPIWHIVSTEYNNISVSQLNTFMQWAGPNASIWRTPGGQVPLAVWDDWNALNWSRSDFPTANCGANNNALYDLGVDSPDAGNGGTPQPATVPYWSQLSNSYDPYGTCSITSLAMVTDFFGLTNPSSLGKRTPDYLYERFGVLQDVPSLAWGFDTIAQEAGSPLRDVGVTNGTIAQLRQLASQGKPTIVHGWFTSPGHIMVVTGFDGTHYTVHDPFGKWNLQKWGSYNTSVSGKNQRYPAAQFEYAINDNGTGDDLWLHIFE